MTANTLPAVNLSLRSHFQPMTNLTRIPGIGKAAVELLEVAGFPDAESLAKAGIDELASELERANRILRISQQAPERADVEKWIASAQDLTGVPQIASAAVMPVNQEIRPQVATMLANSPFAIPLPARFLVEQHLAVGDIPAAILLNRYSGDLEVKIEDRVPAFKHGRPAVPSSNVRLAEVSGTRRDMDVSRIKSIDVLAGRPVKPVGVVPREENERIALLRAPRTETNLGRDPKSRRYIRGVMHSHPLGISAGAVVTLLLVGMLPLGIISSALLLVSREFPEYFSWVPAWLLVFPLSLPAFGIAYMIWGMPASCRICGQKIFVPRMCLKNSKAHRLPGLGHIIPVAIHILLFKWFRCTYCGTPVRLKQ